MKQVSSKEVISTLKSQGWQILPKRGKGSHTMLRSPDGTKTVVVPQAKQQPVGTLKSIERMTEVRFL